MTILFVNGSPNGNGNTAHLAATLLAGHDYGTLNLTDYRINAFGQTLPGDQFDEVIERIKQADVVVLGSPVYWHYLCGSVRTLMERCYLNPQVDQLGGRLFLVFQGAGPEQWMLDAGVYSVERFAGMYGMTYEGVAHNAAEAKKLANALNSVRE